MSPIEELQAAHKRLGDLRDRERVSPGAFHLVAEQGAEQHEVMTRWYANVVEKVELLHGTIDAQLALLAAGIEDETERVNLFTIAGRQELLALHPSSLRTLLTLARAINGATE